MIVQHYPLVIAVVELPIKVSGPYLSVPGAKFVDRILTFIKDKNYQETPDGWLVPIDALLPYIEDLVEVFISEALEFGELEIYGGLEFWQEGNVCLSMPPNSTFRSVANLIRSIEIVYHNGESQTVLVSDNYALLVSLDNNEILIELDKFSTKSTNLRIPKDELLRQSKVISSIVQEFAMRFRDAWENKRPEHFGKEPFDWMFGFDILEDFDSRDY